LNECREKSLTSALLTIAALAFGAVVLAQDASEPQSEALDGFPGRGALDTIIAAVVVVLAIPVAFAVRVVVLALVADQIVESKAVMRGHEVDRVVRMAAARLVEITGARQPCGEVAQLCTIAALTVLGGQTGPQLKVNIEHTLAAGAERREIIEAIWQMAVYGGLPAAINGLNAAREVFEAEQSPR